jgi:hypothetical protein
LYQSYETIATNIVYSSSPINPTNDVVWYTLDEIVRWASSFTPSLVAISLISLAIRIAPFHDYSSVIETKKETVEKEMEAAVLPYNPVNFDYDVIFSSVPESRSRRFHPDIPADASISRSLYADFSRAKSRLHKSTLFPDIGTKTVGKIVKRNYYRIKTETGLQLDQNAEKGDVTCRDLERLYHETGRVVEGPVEVRSAWKYNDLKPRVYYARGGITYHNSKYVQSIFNVVIDALPETHRHDRFLEPEDSTLTEDDLIILYDYASFTSKLDEIKNFVSALATFLDDCELTIVDSHLGLVQTTAGAILREYNEICNQYAEFDIGRLLDEYSEFVVRHTCGMLGVPGNIFSCTSLHGIVLRFIAGRMRSRTVGDDGKIYACQQGRSETLTVLEYHHLLVSIGTLQPSKMTHFGWIGSTELDDRIAHCFQFVKRPYSRVESRVQIGGLLIFPNPAILLEWNDGHHVLPEGTRLQRLNKFGSSLLRFYVRLSIEMPKVTSEHIELVNAFVYACRRMAMKRLATRLSGISKDLVNKRIPFFQEDMIGKTRGEIICMLHDLDEPIEIHKPLWDESVGSGFEGEVWFAQRSRCDVWLERLGYLEVEKEFMTVTRRSLGDEVIADLFDRKFPRSYRISVIRDIPSWCMYIRCLVP